MKYKCSLFWLACDAQRKLARKKIHFFLFFSQCISSAPRSSPSCQCQRFCQVPGVLVCQACQLLSGTSTHTVCFHLRFFPSAFQLFASNRNTAKQLNTNSYFFSCHCVTGMVYKHPSHPHNFQQEIAATSIYSLVCHQCLTEAALSYYCPSAVEVFLYWPHSVTDMLYHLKI